MKYYISISAWNLLESFTTESISPVAFYAERAYGAKLSRFLEDKFDRTYKLILSTKDNGGDYTIEVDDQLVDKKLLMPEKDKTIFSYPKTIYYQKGLVAFRFNTHLTSSSCHPKIFVKEFSYFLMPCHQHCLGVNLLVQR